MKRDDELLREFVRQDAEDAFTELVNRHIGLVYSTACRETRGDLAAAQDVTQLVFIELARKSASLSSHPTLAGWLYTSVRYVSANLRRGNQRRMIREQEAFAMNELLKPTPTDPTWEEIRPVLDDAMHDLKGDDRNAVLLRFFEGRSLQEVGEALRLTENAARMRVERALEKLRRALAKRGVHSTSSALASALVVGMISAPPALTASVAGSALTAASLSTGVASTLFGTIALTKPALVGLSALAVAAVSIPIWQQQRYDQVAEENSALHSQLEETEELRRENQRLNDLLQAHEEQARKAGIEPFGVPARTVAAARAGPDSQTVNPREKRAETWRQRFDAVYKLRGGEMVRRVAPPFIPERTEFCRREFRNLRNNTPDYLVLRQDSRGVIIPFGVGHGWGSCRIEDVLRLGLQLKRYDLFGGDELLMLPVPGDWVVRPNAGVESQLAALEPILREATGRNIRFAKQLIDSDVIIVRGRFKPARETKIDVFAESRSLAWGRSSRGDFSAFLEALGDWLNVPFISEVQVQNPSAISWYCHADADYLRAGSRRLELLNQVLENLKQQMAVTFEVERRPAEVWWVSEQGSTDARRP